MCTLSPPCVIRPNNHWPALEWDGPAVGKKAASRPSEHRIWVERPFWKSLDARAPTSLIAARQKLALVCHEKGHDEGAECEECADTRGGQIFRELGLPDDHAAISMFLTRIQHRSATGAAQAFHSGFANIVGSRPADADACPGSVDGSGLCKVPVLSFHGDEDVKARRSKARARGMDEGQCRCIRAGATKGADILAQADEYARGVIAAHPELLDMPTGGCFPWASTVVAADADTRNPEANVELDSTSCFALRLTQAGGIPPYRATYDPSEYAGRSLPILPPLVIDARGRMVSGPAACMAMEFGADADDPATLAANLLANAPTTAQIFATLSAPAGETLAQILADTAFQYFPDDPYRYAYLMLAIVQHEAGAIKGGSNASLNAAAGYTGPAYNSGAINWNYQDGTHSDNSKTDAPVKAVSSTDWGLGQINDKWHADLTNQQSLDANGVPFASVFDPRLNVGMVAQVLAPARKAFPNDFLSQLNAYGAGAANVTRGLAASPPAAYITSKGQVVALGSENDSGSAEIGWLQGLGIDPNDPTAWTGHGSGGTDTTSDTNLANLVPSSDSDTVGTATPGPVGSPGDATPTDPVAYGLAQSADRKWAIALVVGLALALIMLAKREQTPNEPTAEAA